LDLLLDLIVAFNPTVFKLYCYWISHHCIVDIYLLSSIERFQPLTTKTTFITHLTVIVTALNKMGGKALSDFVQVSRLNWERYNNALNSLLLPRLQRHYQKCFVPPCRPGKEDHGDIDILVTGAEAPIDVGYYLCTMHNVRINFCEVKEYFLDDCRMSLLK
jgi:hypothetical protein